MPSQSVTNMAESLFSASSSFTCVRMLAGEKSFVARDLMSVLVTAMKRAAGTPLPDTSPTQKQKRSSSTRKKS